jgi:hypothetical protein
MRAGWFGIDRAQPTNRRHKPQYKAPGTGALEIGDWLHRQEGSCPSYPARHALSQSIAWNGLSVKGASPYLGAWAGVSTGEPFKKGILNGSPVLEEQ